MFFASYSFTLNFRFALGFNKFFIPHQPHNLANSTRQFQRARRLAMYCFINALKIRTLILNNSSLIQPRSSGRIKPCMMQKRTNVYTVITKRHDVDQHLQAASLCDRNVSLGKRLRYFDAVISPVVVFAAGHRTLCKTDLRNFDVLFRKLLRSVVGPPAGMDWTRPWHEDLHVWNGRVNEFAALHNIKLWSERCIQQHCDLAQNISSLDDQRWVKRLLQWQPIGRRRGGRPAHLWHTVLANFCRWKGLQHWSLESRNHQSWMAMFPDFLHFVNL